MGWWAIEWRSSNRLDGERRYLIWDHEPRLYRTRRECREAIQQRYGYIRDRQDLRTEPHGWRMPRAVKVRVELVEAPLPDSWPDSQCPKLAQHTKHPESYLGHEEWAHRKMRRHYQIRCSGCGLYVIWRRKPAWMADDEHPEEDPG